MDKIAHYRDVTKRVLTEYANFGAQNRQTGIESLLAFDEEHDQYLWLKSGWTQKHRVHGMTLHVRLHQGKIWVEEDWTENGIAADFVNAGVPREDIVLAFCEPESREMTEFAAA